jgi:hypothetical protein
MSENGEIADQMMAGGAELLIHPGGSESFMIKFLLCEHVMGQR